MIFLAVRRSKPGVSRMSKFLGHKLMSLPKRYESLNGKRKVTIRFPLLQHTLPFRLLSLALLSSHYLRLANHNLCSSTKLKSWRPSLSIRWPFFLRE
jgi:hypothetical protein